MTTVDDAASEAPTPAAGPAAAGPGGADRRAGPRGRAAPASIRVLLVDDHALLRAGMARLLDLADDVTVVGSAGSGAEALEMAAALRPDVVLMDLSMPGMSGVEATRRLLAAQPDTAVVVLTSFADPDLVVDALDAGAVGYLLKDAEPDGAGRRRARGGARGVAARPAGGARRADRAVEARPRCRCCPGGRRRCWCWWPRAWPTSRSPAPSASPSAP